MALMTLVDGASFPWLFLHNNTNKRNHDRSRVRLVYYLLQAAYLIFTSSSACENGRRKGRWRRWWQIEATSANPWAVVHGIVGLSSHPKQKKKQRIETECVNLRPFVLWSACTAAAADAASASLVAPKQKSYFYEWEAARARFIFCTHHRVD